jgi:predicted metalloprotease with PDZ domain
MSGELWFAEGFTSYYTDLILARAGIITAEEYVKGLNRTFNYVWNSPGRKHFSPVEMSYQAPFVDAATSVDPVNRENTFISYYSYGSVLGLALDLKLRERGLNLDDYMQLLWKKHGKPENPYTLTDLEELLKEYAGEEFANDFFSNYIYSSKMPDFEKLFGTVGINMSRNPEKAFFGASVRDTEDGSLISGNPLEDSPAYVAGLDAGDKIISVNEIPVNRDQPFEDELQKYKPGETVLVKAGRFGTFIEKEVVLQPDPTYEISLDPEASEKAKQARKKWLAAK